jgi:hypothetical protein
MKQPGSNWTDLRNFTFETLTKICLGNSSLVKSGQTFFMKRETFQITVVDKIKNIHFMTKIMQKNTTEPGRR